MKITLCGSTKFMQAFHDWNRILTLGGYVVYTVTMSKDDTFKPGESDEDTTKRHLDLIHLAKIEESDAILVLNIGNYIGKSTRREIEWALMRGKEVYWVEGEDPIGSSVSVLLNLFSEGPLCEHPLASEYAISYSQGPARWP